MSQSAETAPVGRVVGLWRYPVKSMAAEALTEAHVSWHGITGDRRWAFVRDGLEQSGFPWLTLRERAELWHYRPRLVDPGRPDSSPTVVRTPSGAELDVGDPALAAELWPDGARVIRQDRGIFDAFPVSLITTQTVDRMGELVGDRLHVQRFRPNLLVEADDDRPFAEDDWVGYVLRIGSARVRIDKRDSRCVVINVDPLTAEADPAVLRAAGEERRGFVGVYGSTVAQGVVTVEDAVTLEV